MRNGRIVVLEFAAQIALALAIGLGVSLVLAGATLLLANGDAAETRHAEPLPARSVR